MTTWNNCQDIQDIHHDVAAGEHTRRPFDRVGTRAAKGGDEPAADEPDIGEPGVDEKVAFRTVGRPAHVRTGDHPALPGGDRPV
ncbi:hypothetical protein [Streptomyces sp. NPDC004728]|uniref:hypothetical protein n=1 Tax=Streptomyces sp. NPDC004728 TaxID=3154289 RepID=UPI0033A192DC